jgi:hypothetical protein
VQHPKLKEVIHQDLLNFSSLEGELSGFDACVFGWDDGIRLSTRYVRHHNGGRADLIALEPGDDVHLCLGRGHRQF